MLNKNEHLFVCKQIRTNAEKGDGLEVSIWTVLMSISYSLYFDIDIYCTSVWDLLWLWEAMNKSNKLNLINETVLWRLKTDGNTED